MKSSSELEDEWNDMEGSVEEEILPERISFRLISKEDASKNKDMHFLLRAMKQVSVNRIFGDSHSCKEFYRHSCTTAHNEMYTS